jgi:hypothetical protein
MGETEGSAGDGINSLTIEQAGSGPSTASGPPRRSREDFIHPALQPQLRIEQHLPIHDAARRD